MNSDRMLLLCSQLLLLLAIAVHPTEGIYEDQVDKFDWIIRNLGRVRDVVYSPDTPRFGLVTTDAGVLAKLNLRTGNVEWRFMFPEGEQVDTAVTTKRGVLTLSGQGRYLRLLDFTDGSLIWELVPSTTEPTSRVSDLVHSRKSTSAIYLSDNTIRRVDIESSQVMWSWRPTEYANSVIKKLHLVQSKNAGSFVYAISSIADAIVIHKIEVESGNQQDVKIVHGVAINGDGVTIVLASDDNDNAFVAVESALISLHAGQKMDFATSDLGSHFASVKLGMSSALVGTLANGTRVICSVSSSSKLTVIENVGNAIVGSLGEDISIVTTDDKGITTSKMRSLNGSFSAESTLDLSIQSRGLPDDVFPMVYPNKKHGGLSQRALVVMEDNTIAMVSRKLKWVREEALASIQQAEWVTPADSTEKLIPEVPSIVSTLTELKNFSPQKLDQMFATSSDSKSHFFGFTKLLILLTVSRKLVALHSETGEIFWSRFLRDSYRLLVTRDHPGIGTGPELLLISSDAALWIDANTGNIIQDAKVPTGVRHAFAVEPAHHHRKNAAVSPNRIIVLVSEDMKLHVLPNTEEARQTLTEQSRSRRLFYHIRDGNQWRGFQVINGVKGQQIWSVVIPSSEEVVATAKAHPDEVIDSPVSITGDDSLLLKYANPHLFAVASVVSNPLAVNIALFDAVTGQVVHRVTHSDATGPVNIVITENWVVYSIWSTKHKRTELTSLVLYEGAINAYGLNLWKRPLWPEKVTSFSSPLPIVLQKSFIFPTTIRTLAPTVTARGITSKHILVGMATGQVFSLKREFIDPRRPDEKPTPVQMSEGLLQYSPHVPVWNNQLSMVSYNKAVSRLKHISTTTAYLESTSLMFAFGLDILYLRVAPAKSFDLLASDFKHELLLLLVLGLIVATFILRSLVSRKRLNSAWK